MHMHVGMRVSRPELLYSLLTKWSPESSREFTTTVLRPVRRPQNLVNKSKVLRD